MAITNKRIFEYEPLTFGVFLGKSEDRLDCSWFNPIIENKVENLRKTKSSYWELVRLETFAEVSGGKRLPKGTVITEERSDVIPYIRASQVKNLKVDVGAAARIPKHIHKVIQNYQLQQNDIVITIVGTIGEVGLLEEPVEVCDFSENIARIRIENAKIIPQYLLHFLDSNLGKVQSDRFSVGSLQYKLSLNSCRNIDVYLPVRDKDYSLEIQKKIVKQVYELLEKANQERKRYLTLVKEANRIVEQILNISLEEISRENLKVYAHSFTDDQGSRLDVLFNNPYRERLLSLIRQVPHRKLGNLARIQTRTNIPPSDFYRLVELEDIDENTGQIIKAREVPDLVSQKYLFEKNDLLISRLQPEKGKIAIVNDDYAGCVGSSELISLVLTSSELELEYLWTVLRSRFVLKQWEYEVTGSSRMRIGRAEIGNTLIPVPGRKIQEEIVKRTKEKLVLANRVLKKSESLRKQSKESFLKALGDR